MGILNVTPDSFSDGGQFVSLDSALRRAQTMIAEGADIIDVGGESTRPASDRQRISATMESERVLPVIEAIAARYDVPISIDTTKPEVAKAALDAGAEILNDISGLRWEPELADIAALSRAGLVLMHSRGEFESLHTQPAVDNILVEVTDSLTTSVSVARSRGIANDQIVLDVGIGFGKTPEQNLDLIINLQEIVNEFRSYPILVGASRKSFIPKLLGRDIPPGERLPASLAAAVLAIERGAMILRVHDVGATRQVIDLFSCAPSRETGENTADSC